MTQSKFILTILISALYLQPQGLQAILFAERGRMPLPAEFNNKQVYYIYTPPMPKFSCGYYTLWNAIHLEMALGTKVNPSARRRVREICLRHVEKRQEYAQGTYYEFRQGVADALGLTPFILFTEFDIADVNGRPIIKLCNSHRERIGFPSLAHLKRRFDNKKTDVIHFSPEFFIKTLGANDPEFHVVLMSLVREKNGTKSLYIFDNCHFSALEDPLLQFIRAVYHTFIEND